MTEQLARLILREVSREKDNSILSGMKPAFVTDYSMFTVA